MHRTLKKVAKDFNWPLKQVWKGYINPYRAHIDCNSCGCSGYNDATRKLMDDWYTHSRTDGQEGWGENLQQLDVQALIDADRLRDFTRVPRNEKQRSIVKEKMERGENSWLPESNGYVPTAHEVNRWNKETMGHDSCNHYICSVARAKKMGIYGLCSYCHGEGSLVVSDELLKLHESWENYEPPSGDYYQLWETCSEGSPISPPFSTPQELATWCEEGATIFADDKLNYEKWLEMFVGQEVEAGSMVIAKDGYFGPVAKMDGPQ